eukprot:TRINITY_DN8523_c0_g1_i1.p1 TRINITY_DN8523_c0_g1~~TRINITY_DN8523_c0_g1_i1.p1  ORF type:complete len:266 (+),score=59.39 TRINITY_DN8523_c0_g1_i1:58-855(+)
MRTLTRLGLQKSRSMLTGAVASTALMSKSVFAQETAAAAAGGTAGKIAAAKALYGANVVTLLQVGPPICAQVLFLSPLATMREIKANGTTGGLPMLPYTMMACNGFLWMTYGTLTGDSTLIAANVSALVMGLFYCSTFMKYKNPDVQVAQPVGMAAVAALAVAGMYAGLPQAQAIDAIGMTGCGVVVAMFSGPLAAVQKVLKEKDTSTLPFPMAVATTVNCAFWSAYGLMIGDPYIYGPNLLGLCSGIVQLSLFARFGFGKAKSA